MIELSDVSVSYGDELVLENVSLSVQRGERIAVMGKSGSGKTTLINVIAGLLPVKSGEIYTEGKIACVFQEARLLPWLSAQENILFVTVENEENITKAKQILKELELGDDYDKLPGELSGGMQQRVSIARALLFGADIIILDEPFSALDVEMKEKVISLIKKYGENACIIIITHDIGDAKAISDKIYYIEDKHIKVYA